MKLRTRITILLSIIILTLLAIGGYTYYSFTKILFISNTNEKVNELSINTLELKKHESNFLKWDLVNPEYFETGTSENLSKFINTYNKALVEIDILLENPFIKSAKVVNKINQVKSHLIEHNQTFINFERAKNQFGFKDWGMIGEMRKAIHEVEYEIGKLNNHQLKAHMLMLRRHEKDYLLRRDSKYKTKFETELLSFKTTLQESKMAKTKKREIESLLDAYQSSFFTLLDKDKEIGVTQTSGIMAQLTSSATMIGQEIEHVNRVISIKSENYIKRTIALMVSFIAGCIIICAFLTYFVFRGIYNIMGGEPEHVALIAKNVAEGNLKIDLQNKKEAQGIMKSVMEMTKRLSEIISGIDNNANHIFESTTVFTQTAQNISEGAFSQSSSIDKISATVEEIGANIDHNTASAKETDHLAILVKNDIQKVKEQTDKSLKTSRTIAEKIQVINTIAMQTTILALNAGVEAARAGKDGSGFQVIAEEVKRLAQTSKEAAEEINILTNDNLNQTETVTNLVNDILQPIEKTSDLVKHITLASQEQSTGTAMVSTAVNELYTVSQENTAASQEMAATSVELEKQAQELKKMVAYFVTDQFVTINTENELFKKVKKNNNEIDKVVRLWKKQNKPKLKRV